MENEPMTITILKPIYGSYCSIDKRKLIEAKRNHQMIRLTLVGVGTALIDPQAWWDTAVKREKRVVKYVRNPMTFVYNYLPINTEFKKNKDLSVDQLSII